MHKTTVIATRFLPFLQALPLNNQDPSASEALKNLGNTTKMVAHQRCFDLDGHFTVKLRFYPGLIFRCLEVNQSLTFKHAFKRPYSGSVRAEIIRLVLGVVGH